MEIGTCFPIPSNIYSRQCINLIEFSFWIWVEWTAGDKCEWQTANGSLDTVCSYYCDSIFAQSLFTCDLFPSKVHKLPRRHGRKGHKQWPRGWSLRMRAYVRNSNSRIRFNGIFIGDRRCVMEPSPTQRYLFCLLLKFLDDAESPHTVGHHQWQHRKGSLVHEPKMSESHCSDMCACVCLNCEWVGGVGHVCVCSQRFYLCQVFVTQNLSLHLRPSYFINGEQYEW